jgi:hypothetical protein
VEKSEEITEIELDLATEPEKEAEIEVVKAEEVPEKIIPADDGIAQLRKQLEAERAARADAERRANEAAQQAYRATSEVEDTNLHLINNAIDTVKRNNEILRAQYRDAMAVGDYDKVAEINDAVNENHAKLRDLAAGKDAMERKPKAEAPKPMPSDPVEALASQLTPRSAAWVRAHPECATDPRLYQKMIAAHQLAIADGISPDTDEYFESVEGTLRIAPRRAAEPEYDAMADTAKVTQRRTSPPSAPVSRAGTGTGSRPNVVRLTADEREMAAMMKMSDREYAIEKSKLQKEGKIA